MTQKKLHFTDISVFLDYSLISLNKLPVDQASTLKVYYSGYYPRLNQYIRRHYLDQSREIVSEITYLLSSGCKPRVLEIGCGCGTESLYMGILGASVVSIDIKQDRLDVAKARKKQLESELGDKLDVRFIRAGLFSEEVSQLSLESKFDLIWMEQAYHHIEPRERIASALAHLLNPGGLLIVSEANAWNPFLQLQLVHKRGFQQLSTFTDESGCVHLYGNERVTRPSSMRRLMQNTGFTQSSLRYFRVLPRSTLFAFLWRVERIIPKWIIPLFTHYNIVFKLNP